MAPTLPSGVTSPLSAPRQIGQASVKYADTHTGFLPTPGGYLLQILPYTEHNKVAEPLARSGKPWNDPVNAELVARHLTIAQCPDAPDPDRLIGGKAAPTDYTACPTITLAIRDIFPVGYDLSTPLGGVGTPRGGMDEIADGTSTTFLGILEIADKPNRWQAGKMMPAAKEGGGGGNGTWAANGLNAPRGYSWDGKDFPGPCAMNCSNFAAVYSFHPDGCNFVFADGSVRFLRKEIDVWVFYAGLTRRGGELLGASDF
ncbi:MAG TPA: DUF1559 domain-containing protein [Urbifossiella sp.]|nr:DUF1559 domain-containing protein [Urbifossiella sp.]